MNYLENMKHTVNRYFAVRHGESEANIAGIIISDPETGIKKYGLSDKGKDQSEIAAKSILTFSNKLIIYSSDFKRTSETAAIICQTLNAPLVIHTPLLRERFFGNFEATSNTNYEKIWQKDVLNPDHTEWNSESVNSVLERTTLCVDEIEKRYSGKIILLVSHGDALQILQTAFQNVNASQHRSLKHLETAEIREFILHKE